MDDQKKLAQLCGQIRPLEDRDRQIAKRHWDQIAKPLNGLGRLEEMIIKIAAIQQSELISIEKKAVVVMCADNGIVAEGVTQSGSEVTAIVAANMAKGIASVNRMARVAGADVIPIDIGMAVSVDHPHLWQRKIAMGTPNFAKQKAMSAQEAVKAIITGIEIVKELKDQGYQVLGTGEMGIGNTTTSSAVTAVLLSLPAVQVTGKGAGLSAAGVKRKAKVISDAIKLHQPDRNNPIEILSAVGGFDLAGLMGVILGGAIYRVPIVLDGFISLTAALLAKQLVPDTVGYLLPSHLGKEPACHLIMEELGLTPMIYGQLALGEGTGAVLLFPMLEMANQVYQEYTTFEDIKIEAYKELN